MPPKFASAKKQGEWAEQVYQVKASGMGLRPCRPWGETAPYDFAVEGLFHHFNTVQVKSVGWTKSDRPGLYHVFCCRGNVSRGKRVSYSPEEVHYLAVYLIPEDLWYIIPIRALRGVKGFYLRPKNPRKVSRFERYREAWHQLF